MACTFTERGVAVNRGEEMKRGEVMSTFTERGVVTNRGEMMNRGEVMYRDVVINPRVISINTSLQNVALYNDLFLE
jgi:hypothetical protein